MGQGKHTLARTLFAAASLTALAAPASSVHALSVYTESGDAGQTLATAQATASAAAPAGTSLTGILGAVSAQQDADLYAIRIDSLSTFSATLSNSTTLDATIFLFGSDGTPIATNDDASGTNNGGSLAVGNALYVKLTPGIYILGISASGNEATNSVSQLLFAGYVGGDTTSTRGPAAETNPSTLATFNGKAFPTAGTGTYSVTLTGVSTAAIPEPSTCVLLSFSAAATISLLRRRPALSA